MSTTSGPVHLTLTEQDTRTDTREQSLVAHLSDMVFKHPRPCEDVYVSHAYMPNNRRVQICIPNGRVLGVSTGLTKTCTATVSLTACQSRRIMELDKMVLDVAREKVGDWFQGSMDSRLIEEYYRPVATASLEYGVCARVLLVANKNTHMLLPGNKDITLQLVGLHFRKQHFSLLWRLVEVSEQEQRPGEKEQDIKKIPDSRVPAPNNTVAGAENGLSASYMFREPAESAADGNSESEEDEHTRPLPSWEEYEDMRREVLSRLESKDAELSHERRVLREVTSVLRKAANQDIRALEKGIACVDSSL